MALSTIQLQLADREQKDDQGGLFRLADHERAAAEVLAADEA